MVINLVDRSSMRSGSRHFVAEEPCTIVQEEPRSPRQLFISPLNVLKLVLGHGLEFFSQVRDLVRVVPVGLFPVRPFDLIHGCGAIHPQDGIGVPRGTLAEGSTAGLTVGAGFAACLLPAPVAARSTPIVFSAFSKEIPIEVCEKQEIVESSDVGNPVGNQVVGIDEIDEPQKKKNDISHLERTTLSCCIPPVSTRSKRWRMSHTIRQMIPPGACGEGKVHRLPCRPACRRILSQ